MNTELQKIIDLIPYGEEHAISMPALARTLDMTEREARKVILQLRLAGYIVAGTSSGYFVPDTDDELISYYQTAKARGITTLASLTPARLEMERRGIFNRLKYQTPTKAHSKEDYNICGGDLVEK